MVAGAEAIVRDLFARYMAEPGADAARLARSRRRRRAAKPAARRVVADFVAGMTDRFAINEHRRLFDATPELR